MTEKYQIEIKCRFRAGHRLIEPYKGKCNNPHGEGYTTIFIFERNEINECGMVADFGKVKEAIQKVIDNFYDHAFLFNVSDKILPKMFHSLGYKIYLMNSNPTAENIAKDLFIKVKKIFPILKRVGIVESFDDSIAWYENNEPVYGEFDWKNKKCEKCGKLISGFSEWCTYHFSKRRDFCSQKCFSDFVKYYEAEKELQELKPL